MGLRLAHSKRPNELQIWKLGEDEPLAVRLDESVEPGNIAGWTPDNKWIYIQYRLRTNISRLLGRISVPLREFEPICATAVSHGNMRLSPDGKYLAFNTTTTPQDNDIRLMTADGREQTVLWKHTGTDYFLSWTPDGRSIIYSERIFNEYNLCLMGIENSRPSGNPVSVHTFGTRIESADMTKNGTFYLTTSLHASAICTAKIDLKTGTVIRPAQAVEPAAMGQVSRAIWSPDGDSLAYFVQKNSTLTTRFISMPSVSNPSRPGSSKRSLWILRRIPIQLIFTLGF